MDILAYLDRARRAAGIPSRAALARRLGCDPTTIIAYERGHVHPMPERLMAIADLAGIPRDQAILDYLEWQLDGAASRAALAEVRERARLSTVGSAQVTSGPNRPHSIHYGKSRPRGLLVDKARTLRDYLASIIDAPGYPMPEIA